MDVVEAEAVMVHKMTNISYLKSNRHSIFYMLKYRPKDTLRQQ